MIINKYIGSVVSKWPSIVCLKTWFTQKCFTKFQRYISHNKFIFSLLIYWFFGGLDYIHNKKNIHTLHTYHHFNMNILTLTTFKSLLRLKMYIWCKLFVTNENTCFILCWKTITTINYNKNHSWSYFLELQPTFNVAVFLWNRVWIL